MLRPSFTFVSSPSSLRRMALLLMLYFLLAYMKPHCGPAYKRVTNGTKTISTMSLTKEIIGHEASMM